MPPCHRRARHEPQNLRKNMAGDRNDDALLWLAAENEYLRRTVRNDRETIAHLRSQLHTAKRALRTLHAQGVGADRSEQHRCLLAQLSNLDRLALDWARRCEAVDDEARELCKLRVDHAQVLEASQALRAVHEASIRSLQAELESVQAQCQQAEGAAESLIAAEKQLSKQVEALSCRVDLSKKDAGASEIQTQTFAAALETQLQDLENMLSSYGGVIFARLEQLRGNVATARAMQDREAEARKQRDVQVKHLMKLVRTLEERNGGTLQKLETLEEELSATQQSAAAAARHLQEKEKIIECLDRQCEAYELALKSKKRELGAQKEHGSRQQAPLAVSKLTNREHMLARPPSRDAKPSSKPGKSPGGVLLAPAHHHCHRAPPKCGAPSVTGTSLSSSPWWGRALDARQICAPACLPLTDSAWSSAGAKRNIKAPSADELLGQKGQRAGSGPLACTGSAARGEGSRAEGAPADEPQGSSCATNRRAGSQCISHSTLRGCPRRCR